MNLDNVLLDRQSVLMGELHAELVEAKAKLAAVEKMAADWARMSGGGDMAQVMLCCGLALQTVLESGQK